MLTLNVVFDRNICCDYRSKELCRTLGALSMLDHQPDVLWWQAFEGQVSLV